MNLKQFTEKVNYLARKECEEMNKKESIFHFEHYDYCEMMLKIYHEQGLTPKETLDVINDELEQEGICEALAS